VNKDRSLPLQWSPVKCFTWVGSSPSFFNPGSVECVCVWSVCVECVCVECVCGVCVWSACVWSECGARD
jgi:hypothetical protein